MQLAGGNNMYNLNTLLSKILVLNVSTFGYFKRYFLFLTRELEKLRNSGETELPSDKLFLTMSIPVNSFHSHSDYLPTLAEIFEFAFINPAFASYLDKHRADNPGFEHPVANIWIAFAKPTILFFFDYLTDRLPEGSLKEIASAEPLSEPDDEFDDAFDFEDDIFGDDDAEMLDIHVDGKRLAPSEFEPRPSDVFMFSIGFRFEELLRRASKFNLQPKELFKLFHSYLFEKKENINTVLINDIIRYIEAKLGNKEGYL